MTDNPREEYWDERYRAKDFVWGVEPNQFVARHLADLPPGRALDLGAGEGRNAVWLATRGHTVIAVELSTVALERGRRLAAAADVAVTFVHADLRTWSPDPAGFDLVLLSYLQVPPDLRVSLHDTARRALAPGGVVFVVAHHLDNLEHGVGGPPDPANLFTEDMLRADFAGLEIERCERVTRIARAGTEEEGEAIDVVLLARSR